MPDLRSISFDSDELNLVNELFDSVGLTAVDTLLPGQQIIGMYVDDELVGAVHSATPILVAFTLQQAGMPTDEAANVAGGIQAIEQLAVAPATRGRGYGPQLVEAIARLGREELSAEYVIAKIDAASPTLARWYEAQGFEVAKPGVALQIVGVPIPTSPEHREAWMRISPSLSESDVVQA